MTPSGPDIRAYLEIRTASPASFSPDGTRLLVSTDLSGTHQAHLLELPDRTDAPAATTTLPVVTSMEEPVGAAYLPDADDGAVVGRLLLVTDRGGNERTQIYTAADDRPPQPFTSPDELDPLVVDPDHIHRPGGVTRDGRWLAYATNRDDGVAFDTWLRRLADGAERRVFATGGWTGPAGFSPDGRWLAVSELTEEPGDNRLVLIDTARIGDEPAGHGDDAVVELAAHQGSAHVGSPSWLADNEAFYFATDVGREFTALARATPDGAWRHVIDTGWPTGCAVDWTGQHLVVAWNEGGVSRAALHDAVSGERRMDVEMPGDGVAGGMRFSRDGRRLAFSYSSPLLPGDVWSVDTATGVLQRLTESPCGVDAATFVDVERSVAPSFDGLEIPLFVFRARRTPGASRRRPVVVVLHGGPESQYRPSFAPLTQYLVANGYSVVAPNVRGSTGYGRSYQHLDDVERRFDAIRDLAAIHDWIAADEDLDEERVALYGGSYGGYLVLAGLAFQPQRWAAGVDIVGISNLVTFLENTAPWRRRFREREYGSLEHDRDLLERLSPITHADEIRAPLMIVHGANDPRVPLGEAEQIHEMLRGRGVRSDLLVYPDEGHGLAKLANRVDAYPRVVEFLDDVIGS